MSLQYKHDYNYVVFLTWSENYLQIVNKNFYLIEVQTLLGHMPKIKIQEKSIYTYSLDFFVFVCTEQLL